MLMISKYGNWPPLNPLSFFKNIAPSCLPTPVPKAKLFAAKNTQGILPDEFV